MIYDSHLYSCTVEKETEAATGGVLWKKVFLKISQKCKVAGKKETGAGVSLWTLRNF